MDLMDSMKPYECQMPPVLVMEVTLAHVREKEEEGNNVVPESLKAEFDNHRRDLIRPL
jgi:hypothetical protein